MSFKNLQNTTNKSDRNIDERFDLKKFNQTFEKNDLKLNKLFSEPEPDSTELLPEPNSTKILPEPNSTKILPHQKSIEYNLINIYKLILKIFNLLINFKNPIPYIFSTYDNQFAFSILLIGISIIIILLLNVLQN
jgi:hypothetical protein